MLRNLFFGAVAFGLDAVASFSLGLAERISGPSSLPEQDLLVSSAREEISGVDVLVVTQNLEVDPLSVPLPARECTLAAAPCAMCTLLDDLDFFEAAEATMWPKHSYVEPDLEDLEESADEDDESFVDELFVDEDVESKSCVDEYNWASDSDDDPFVLTDADKLFIEKWRK